jgi:hypothetical protein
VRWQALPLLVERLLLGSAAREVLYTARAVVAGWLLLAVFDMFGQSAWRVGCSDHLAGTPYLVSE